MKNHLKKIDHISFRIPKTINVSMALGVVGLLLLPIDSFRYFPLSTDNRPIWVIPFILLFFYVLLQKQTIKRYVLVFSFLAIYYIIKSFLLYNAYQYPNYAGLIKGAVILVLLIFTLGGLIHFLKMLQKRHGDEFKAVLAKLLLYSSILPLLLGIIQLFNVLGIQFLGKYSIPITHFFSVRYNSEIRLQLTTGEPAWAATYLIFVFLFVFLFYTGRYKKLILIVYSLFFLLTGSTLGFLYATIIGSIYFLLFLKRRDLFKIIVFLAASILCMVYVYDLLPEYTKHKIGLVSGLISDLSIRQILFFASMDFSFISRFLNPVIGFKLGIDGYLFGIGIEAFQYHVLDQLKEWGLLDGATEGYKNALLSSGGTPKFLFSKIFCELGAIAFFTATGYYCWLIYKNWLNKKLVLLLIASVVLVFNFDSYLFYAPLIILVVAQIEVRNTSFSK